jgi:branched-chain amino acid transport system substrate-binding protein
MGRRAKSMLRFNKAWLLLVGVTALLTLAAVACGGGDNGEEGTKTPSATGTAAVTQQATGTTTAEGTQTPATGVTDSSKFDNPDIGLPPGKIILGAHFVQTGTYGAAFSPVLSGIQAYFKYLNEEKGGVCGRQIDYKAYDDQYDPSKAVEATRRLVEQDKIFAMISGLGTAAHSAVWDYLNEKGIPDLWIMTGAHKWNDPEGHPWSVGFLPDYLVEGTIVGKWIAQNMANAKVGILYQNDDWGADVLAGLKDGLGPSNELVAEQSYESTAVDVRSQVTNIKQKGAEVVMCACLPGTDAQLVKSADALGWDPQIVIDYVASDPIMFQYASPKLMEGVLTLQANKLSTWDDPAVAWHKEIMKKYGTVAPGNYTMVGQVVGQLTEEVLKRSCNNLTRQGLMDAVNSLKDFAAPPDQAMTLPGVTTTITKDDHLVTRAMRFLRAKLVDNKGVWEYEGELISFR